MLFRSVSNVTESTGLDAGSAAHAIDHIAKAQSELKHGSLDATRQTDKLASAFAALGISVAQVESLSPQQLFFKIAEAMQEAAAQGKLTGEQIAAMKEVLGKAGPELIPAFAKGFSGNLNAELNTLTEDQIKDATAAAGKLKTLQMLWQSGLQNLLTGNRNGDDLAWYNPARWISGATSYFLGAADLSTEVSNEPVNEAQRAGRERLTQRDQARLEADAEKRDQAIHDKKFGEEAKKLEAEIAAERLKQGTPEEKRAALLKDIAEHEKEIAEIRKRMTGYAAYSETEARLRIDKEELEIAKRKNALAELDKKHEHKDEGDRWHKLGIDASYSTLTVVPTRTAAQDIAATRKNIASLERERANLTAHREGDLPDSAEALSPDVQRRVEIIDRLLNSARRHLTDRYFPTQREESDPGFVGPPRGAGSTTVGATVPVGATALVPASAESSEQNREVITQLDVSNSTQREMATLLRRMADSLA